MLQVDAVMYHNPTKSMATEIPSRHASWEAPRNNYMTLSGSAQDAVLVAKAQNCLSSVQENLRQLVMCLGRKVWLF